jgi:hypothetical protein
MTTSERATFLDAATAFRGLVARLPRDVWDGPGLGVWDLRALVGHTLRSVITVREYLERPTMSVVATTPQDYYDLARSVATPEAVAARGVAAGALLGTRPADVVDAMCADTEAALAAVPAGTDPIVSTVVGGMPLSAYLPTRTFELAVHCGDIGRAGGIDTHLPHHVLAAALELAVRLTASRGSGESLLAAVTGRMPLPPGFSVL